MKHACKRVSQLTSESFDRDLSLAEKLQLKLHFAMCGLCRNYHQSLQTMAGIFEQIREHDLKQDIQLPIEAKQRIQSVLEKEK
ncbi:MAG: zf-HC2 domain-containing protein [Mariprofundaceae bacterium]|nr:zf-HC2 domain-containing protein [Mariprofundaceae bacterium]